MSTILCQDIGFLESFNKYVMSYIVYHCLSFTWSICHMCAIVTIYRNKVMKSFTWTTLHVNIVSCSLIKTLFCFFCFFFQVTLPIRIEILFNMCLNLQTFFKSSIRLKKKRQDVIFGIYTSSDFSLMPLRKSPLLSHLLIPTQPKINDFYFEEGWHIFTSIFTHGRWSCTNLSSIFVITFQLNCI